MKAKRKIITNRPQISNSEILHQKQPFKELVKNYYSASFGGGSGFSSFLGWGIGGLTILTVATVIYFSEMSPSENLNEKAVVENNDSLTLEEEQEYTQNRSINPPFADLVHYEKYKVKNNRKPRTITTKNGSKIHLPAKAFVDEKGKDVTKNVEIKYRDFYNPLDFYLSGIPMDYDSAGTNFTFTSAGMFEINATSDGKQLYLKDGKTIDIDLVSNEESTYNFYNYDTLENEWTYQYSESPTDISIYKIKEEAVLKSEENSDTSYGFIVRETGWQDIRDTIPLEQKNMNTMSIISFVDKGYIGVREPVNYSFLANKEMLKNTEYASMDSLMLEIDPEENFAASNYSVMWDKVELDKNDSGLFIQLIKDRKVHAYAVTPVVSPKVYNQAVQDFNKIQQRSGERTAEARKRQKELASVSEATNNWAASHRVSIVDLGIYNCDTPLPMPQFARRGKRYLYDSDGNRLYYNQLYVVQTNENALWQYPSRLSWYYSENLTNVAWFVTDKGKLAIIYPDKFKGIPQDRCIASVYDSREGLNRLKTLIN